LVLDSSSVKLQTADTKRHPARYHKVGSKVMVWAKINIIGYQMRDHDDMAVSIRGPLFLLENF